MHLVDDAIHQLAARQHGTFSRAQAVELGATRNLVRARVDSGRWDVLARGVYGVPGHRPSFRRRLWVAVHHGGPGTLVSHQSAGTVLGMEGVRRGLVTVSVPRHRSGRPDGVVWHRLADHADGDVTDVDGLPVTGRVRTIVDLAAVLGQASLDHLVEVEIVAGRTTVAAVGDRLAGIRRRGKPGVGRLSTTLDRLGPGDDLPRSELERLLDHVVAMAGLPHPVHEHPLPSARGMAGFVDRWFPAARLVVEADGRRWHTRRADMARDRERDLQLARLGIQTVRLVWEHLDHAAAQAADDLRAVHDARVALLSGYGA